MDNKRIIIGITGATGSIYGIRLLEILRSLEIETHLVVTKSGKIAIQHETEYTFDEVISLASYYYNNADIAASIASGSFLNTGMIIAPCTVKTMSEIACCTTHTLITRAADVILKERRKLVLLFRETPLHLGHIRNMAKVTEYGAIVFPPMTTFYNHPQSIMDMVDHTISRVLDIFDIPNNLSTRWDGLNN